MSHSHTVLLLNGSPSGSSGNTQLVLNRCASVFSELGVQSSHIDLASVREVAALEPQLRAAHGFVFATGTYWQSWGSPMQRFFEDATRWEGTDLWFGKPAATVVTMHSVGGLEVLARLNLNLTMLGLLIPPHSCMVHSLVAQLARKSSSSDDIWDLESLPLVCANLVEAVRGTHRYQPWAVDVAEGRPRIWIEPE